MYDQSIDQNIFAMVMHSITLNKWPWAKEHMELIPASWGKYSGLRTFQTFVFQ